MKRFAFKMYLKPGCEKEYAKRHAAIWPELKQMIKDAGVMWNGVPGVKSGAIIIGILLGTMTVFIIDKKLIY